MLSFGGARLMRRPAVLVSAILVAALVGALATGLFMQRAASQPAPATLRACINPFTGAMRFLTYGSCTPPEYMVQWNQQGIQGEQGEVGEQGDQGVQGPAGPPTFLDTYMVSERHNLGGDEGGDEGGGGGGDGRAFTQAISGPFMASCEAGDLLVAGGYELIADGDMESAPLILSTRPFVQPPGNGGGGDGDEGGEEGPTEAVESWLVSVEHSGLSGVDVWAICNVTGGEED